jgi:hypothetical protein
MSFYLPLSSQSIESLELFAQKNGTAILEIEKSILEKSIEVSNKLKKLKNYSKYYNEGTLICGLSQEDFNKYQTNLNVLTDIYQKSLPSLISDSENYLKLYLGLSNDDINEPNTMHLNTNKIPNFPPVHFNGSEAPPNSNLQLIDSDIYPITPVYNVNYTDVLPIYLPNVNKQVLPILALANIELRINNPEMFFSDEFPNLNIPTPGYTYQTNGITWQEVLYCAAVAIGTDFLWGTTALTPGQGNKWTQKAIIKAFGKIASRMLGPVGTAIAVGSFGLCLYEVSD